jgi:hypothetical protein
MPPDSERTIRKISPRTFQKELSKSSAVGEKLLKPTISTVKAETLPPASRQTRGRLAGPGGFIGVACFSSEFSGERTWESLNLVNLVTRGGIKPKMMTKEGGR